MMKKKWQLRQTEGQSLVELALALPLLLVMFVGLIEVGYALRNYLIVVNANREGTRFAARGRWFQDHGQEIFKRVVAAGGYTGTGADEVPILRLQGAGDKEANTTIAVTLVEIPDQVDSTGGMVIEDPIIYGPWYTGTLSYESEIDAVALAESWRQANYDFNEQYFVSGEIDIPSEDNFVIVEVWYEHKQLLGLPIFTEIMPDVIPLYAHTTMRVTINSRVE
jgi:hypothetical protein